MAFSDSVFAITVKLLVLEIMLLNTLLLMVVAFLPFATSVLAGALRSGHGQRTAVGPPMRDIGVTWRSAEQTSSSHNYFWRSR